MTYHMKIAWDPKLSVNLKEIDHQHQTFILILEEVTDAAEMTGGKYPLLTAAINKLQGHVEYHFTTEEKFFELFNYADAVPHAAEHRRQLELVEDFRRRHYNGEDVAAALAKHMMAWLADHIEVMDRKYVQCFKDHGIE